MVKVTCYCITMAKKYTCEDVVSFFTGESSILFVESSDSGSESCLSELEQQELSSLSESVMSSVDDSSVDDIVDTGELTDSNDVILDNSSEPSAKKRRHVISDSNSNDSMSSEDSDDCDTDNHKRVPVRGRGRAYVRGRGRAQSRARGAASLRGKGSTFRDALSRLPDDAVSITVKDSMFSLPFNNDFLPLRDPGPHLPCNFDMSVLSLFELYFDDTAIERIKKSTLAYAEANKNKLLVSYEEFCKSPLTAEEIYSYLGALILLGIHNVRNHRYAWSSKKAQVLCRLDELMSCRRYEIISTFFHLVTPTEETALSGNRLSKILPFQEYIKCRCTTLYQPLQQLSIDERMVKSKARTHFRQYMRNKPTKWGFKYWVLADITGYTVDFNIYLGKVTASSGKGLSYDVVMDLIQPYSFQGYEVYVDNFYTSPL